VATSTAAELEMIRENMEVQQQKDLEEPRKFQLER
jgi:hypothetical protein